VIVGAGHDDLSREEAMTKLSMTRRALVSAAAAGAVGLAADPAKAQRCPPVGPRTKGPLVFRDLDQIDIDEGYDNDVYAFNVRTVNERRGYNSRISQARLGKPESIKYGPTDIELLNFYKTSRTNAPVLVFIQGGSWRGGGRAEQFASYAEPYVKAGANFAILDFADVRDVGGNIFTLRDQVRRAIASVYRNAKSVGGDPDRLYTISRSSGSHLASCMLITDWEKEGLPRDIIKGSVMGSGLYDLAPVRLSKRSQFVNFTDAMVEELSAIRHIDKITSPLVVANGTLETPEFQRQGREFAAALKAAGKSVEYILAPGYNHFEVGETIGHPYAVLGRATMAMVGLDKV